MNDRIVVIGCGSIGQRHLKNLRTLGIERPIVFDPIPERMAAAEQVGARPARSLEAAFEGKPDAAVICTPPSLHASQARTAVQAGASVFVEKPFTLRVQDAEEIVALAAGMKRVVSVGYNLRFHPALKEIKRLLEAGSIGSLLAIRAEFGQYLPDWRPGRDYREGYNAQAGMGGDLMLDCSHEIDYVRWLAGEVSAVFAISVKLSELDIQGDDTALLTLRFASGAVGELHLDCIQRGYSRQCKLIGTDGTLHWDYADGIRLYSATTKAWKQFPIVAEPNVMFLDEMAHFLACVRGEATPLVTGADGRRVVEIALAARRASAERREVEV
jgi:predicted dehydrogenase